MATSRKRKKERPVLVRLEPDVYARLSAFADRDGLTRAEYLRRRVGEPEASSAANASSLSDTDRALLSNCMRTLGQLGGLMKLAALKLPALGSSAELRRLLEAHAHELQAAQSDLRDFLKVHSS